MKLSRIVIASMIIGVLIGTYVVYQSFQDPLYDIGNYPYERIDPVPALICWLIVFILLIPCGWADGEYTGPIPCWVWLVWSIERELRRRKKSKGERENENQSSSLC